MLVIVGALSLVDASSKERRSKPRKFQPIARSPWRVWVGFPIRYCRARSLSGCVADMQASALSHTAVASIPRKVIDCAMP